MKEFTRFLLLAFVAWRAGAQPTPSANGGYYETLDFKVLKVYAAKDGEHIFRAYLIDWHGQDVIARDPLAKVNAHTDDTIKVLVSHSPFPRGAESYGLLHFTAMLSGSRPRLDPETPPAGNAPNLPPSVVSLTVLNVYAAEDKG